MQIEKIVLRRMRLALRAPFETSFKRMETKDLTVAEVHAGGLVGYGECAAIEWPLYNEEMADTAYIVLRDVLAPMLLRSELARPEDAARIFAPVRRNLCAKAALDEAVWDLFAKERGLPLYKALGGKRSSIEVGVSIGMQPSPEALAETVARFKPLGYRRFKIKICPGHDIAYLKAVRDRFPDITITVDANSAYRLSDIAALRALDDFNLLFIEQPLAHDDIVDHAQLQRQLRTAICLDESIDTIDDARNAIALSSCRVINIKVARVGGLTNARAIHDLCADSGIGVWCGGMLDLGIAKAHNMAIATLPNYIYAHDIPPSSRNWNRDIVKPAITMRPDGFMDLPQVPGIGFEPDWEMFGQHTVRVETVTR